MYRVTIAWLGEEDDSPHKYKVSFTDACLTLALSTALEMEGSANNSAALAEIVKNVCEDEVKAARQRGGESGDVWPGHIAALVKFYEAACTLTAGWDARFASLQEPQEFDSERN